MDMDLKGQYSAIGEIGDFTILWIQLLNFFLSINTITLYAFLFCPLT